jgi:hypothetical protein
VNPPIQKVLTVEWGLYMLEDIVGPEEGWNDNAAGGWAMKRGRDYS